MKSKMGNLVTGVILLILSIYTIVNELIGNDTELLFLGILFFSIAVMFLSLAYLHNQFKKKDERMKMIRERAMFYSYFAIMVYYFIFIILLGLNLINLSPIETIEILASLTIITVFLSQVVLSKIY
ncbi:permease [Pallidibacillus thermolactis]|jgi:magnesium-transporting ATPase (P-type)|uniref:permease n=1 Tax=Pallidibacillus thermolactis TaxID=251051 RepID=UPI002E1D8EBC|nr:permease [Pallidibacillus thermolactis subsp. kokeshiiformis]